VLVFAGVDLIFFIAASKGLCFGFVTKTVVIDVFDAAEQSYTESRPFLFLTSQSQQVGWRCTEPQIKGSNCLKHLS